MMHGHMDVKYMYVYRGESILLLSFLN